MKKFERYICILFVVSGFISAYIIGYKIGNKEEDNDNQNIVRESTYQQSDMYRDNTTDVAQSDSVVKEDATLVIETVNEKDKENIVTHKLDIPVEMIGLTRNDIVEYLEEHSEYFDEKGEEIDSLLLVSFSPEQVVIRKNVHEVEMVIYTNEDSERYNYYIECEKMFEEAFFGAR